MTSKLGAIQLSNKANDINSDAEIITIKLRATLWIPNEHDKTPSQPSGQTPWAIGRDENNAKTKQRKARTNMKYKYNKSKVSAKRSEWHVNEENVSSKR